ncbi:capsular polysaccharide transport system permease protein [Gemmobacter aquatilis]|uniref:Capsular polysaccharide transport system permease protein n=1 Tax=Gemmobacter aquatilis TaxID=933059 RepID=A0A1H8GQ91_9RHOB|nr:capsule biosynthesis protein [Gemmobacter aquatilis]SEN45667.1 capsular polysaccharide transport system permease protein [Gemmobacter aquatilis]
MNTKLTAKRFRVRKPETVEPLPPRKAAPADLPGEMLFEPRDDGFGAQSFLPPDPAARVQAGKPAPAPTAAGTDLEAIKREGLTGRQLRLARRLAQKHNLPATSDFDAVRLLRKAGIDPFQRASLLELIGGGAGGGDDEPPNSGTRALAPVPGDGVRLPQTIKPIQVPSTEVRAEQNHAADIMRIQRDLAKRRRRKAALLALRLFFFVGLPTLLAGFYYYFVATPLYAAKTEFVIQQSSSVASGGAGGLGGLLSGTGFATSQDSITVQGYLQSRDAMLRLDKDLGYRAHFSDPAVDPVQRLSPDATQEAAYKSYSRNIHISYDPSEGLIRMEVLATDPAKAVDFSQALISYAEEQVDELTLRMREDQMKGARDTYENAEQEMLDAQRRVVELQEKYKVLSSEVEVQLITTQITQLDTQLTADRLSLQQMQSNANPNRARMDPLVRRIAAMEAEVASLRSKLTETTGGGESLAVVQGELLVAQADVQTRQLLLAQSLQAMEAARVEANRQVRYLSVSVSPVPPDEAAYPRAFENTMVALLIFGGIYLMISMTVAILREQATA